MNNQDRRILIGEMRLKAGAALIIFLIISLVIAILAGVMVALGNPSLGIIKRAGAAMLVVLILDIIIFRRTFLLAIDLIRLQKIRICYDSVHRSIDKSEFINMTELLSKLSKSGNFEKIDFNESFRVELSKSKKEILYIEQFGEVIFPRKE